eukprot:2300275-Prorocentrum_lima.AAC.1
MERLQQPHRRILDTWWELAQSPPKYASKVGTQAASLIAQRTAIGMLIGEWSAGNMLALA